MFEEVLRICHRLKKDNQDLRSKNKELVDEIQEQRRISSSKISEEKKKIEKLQNRIH